MDKRKMELTLTGREVKDDNEYSWFVNTAVKILTLEKTTTGGIAVTHRDSNVLDYIVNNILESVKNMDILNRYMVLDIYASSFYGVYPVTSNLVKFYPKIYGMEVSSINVAGVAFNNYPFFDSVIYLNMPGLWIMDIKIHYNKTAPAIALMDGQGYSLIIGFGTQQITETVPFAKWLEFEWKRNFQITDKEKIPIQLGTSYQINMLNRSINAYYDN